MADTIPTQCNVDELLNERVGKKNYIKPELIDLDNLESTEVKAVNNPTEASPATGPS
ncbi:MAG TPA: hypothetical protein VFM46_18910 [Pseudomonadales bacterium]|nr:hypothetical protein [Pseudomonadales bacterium]